MNKEAHMAFCRSAPHWEAPHRHWEFFAMAKPCHTILCCCTGEESPLDRAARSLHSTTGPQESSGEASSAGGSLPQTTTNSNKYYLISWKTLEKEIRVHTLITNTFFYRSIWAILRWRYESWIRKGNKETLSSEKWWSISKTTSLILAQVSGVANLKLPARFGPELQGQWEERPCKKNSGSEKETPTGTAPESHKSMSEVKQNFRQGSLFWKTLVYFALLVKVWS